MSVELTSIQSVTERLRCKWVLSRRSWRMSSVMRCGQWCSVWDPGSYAWQDSSAASQCERKTGESAHILNSIEDLLSAVCRQSQCYQRGQTPAQTRLHPRNAALQMHQSVRCQWAQLSPELPPPWNVSSSYKLWNDQVLKHHICIGLAARARASTEQSAFSSGENINKVLRFFWTSTSKSSSPSIYLCAGTITNEKVQTRDKKRVRMQTSSELRNLLSLVYMGWNSWFPGQ